MNDSSYERLLIERRDHGVVMLTLSNPGKLNATDATLHAELATVFADIHRDSTIRAVVVTGQGDAFSAGGDLEWLATKVGDHAQTMRMMREAGDIVRTMIDCDTPIISAINGVAVGAGLAVALMADISIIDEATRFTDGHLRLGIAAGDHAVAIWPLLCGMAKAKYYLLLCEAVDGEEAERIGLVSLCVEDDQLEAKGIEVATKLAEGAQTSIRFTKYALNNWLRMMGPSFDASTALEMLGFLGPDVKEGLASHLEKRKPKFDPYSPL